MRNRENIEALMQALADTGRLPPTPPDLAQQQLRNVALLSRIASCATATNKQHQVVDHGRWGPLDIVEKIGEGGFAKVYRAYDPHLERDVALKLIQPNRSLLVDTQAYAHEAKRLARVRHPNVLAIHGVAEHDGLAGIWTDLVDGPTMEGAISSAGPLDAPSFLVVAQQLAGALAAIHSAGLTHGDIKPNNVLIDDTHGAILADFGAAAEVSESGESTVLQATSAYMAPEMLTSGCATEKSDIYALGWLYCYVRTGISPAADEDLDKARPWSAVRDKAIGKLIKSMLNPDPAARPSIAEVVNALTIVEQQPQRRARALVFSVVILALSAIGLAALIAWQSSEQALRQTTAAMARSEAVKEFLLETLQRTSPLRSDSQTSVSDLLRSAAVSIGDRFEGDPMVHADLQLALGQALLAWGDQEQAEPLLVESALTYSAAGAVDTALRAEISVARAKTDRAQRLAALRALQARVSDEAIAPETRALYWARMGSVLGSQSEMDEADDAFKRAETIWSALGQPIVANRGVFHLEWSGYYWRMSEYRQAVEQSRLAREIFLQVYGQYNNNVLAANTNLSHALIRLGQLDEAEAVLKIAVEQSRRLFGEQHERTLSTINSRAGVLLEQGRDGEALPLYEALMIDVESRPTPWSLDTIAVVINYANNLRYVGRAADAEAQYVRVIEGSMGRTGTGAVQHALAKHNYAELLLSIDRADDAFQYQNEALTGFKQVFAEDHLFVLEARENLAWYHLLVGNAQLAMHQVESVLQSKTEQLGANDLFTLEAMELKADVLLRLGQVKDAQSIYQSVHDERLAQLGSTHRATTQVASKLSAGKP
ncbi:MAG: hypothetical protein DHS20C11_14690 [Lysobacteraceae bacterium]|nr:MAG: hypothetical protein DHS20C11_14690 [Xanthomonadaceae bacterium]